MEYKFEDRSKKLLDLKYHEFIEAADHINQWEGLANTGHAQRLYQSIDMIKKLIEQKNISSVTDFGCGNGGLLSKLIDYKNIEYSGFDLIPQNIQYARKKYQLNNCYLYDFLNETYIYEEKYDDIKYKENELKFNQMSIMTETLEHLEEPHKFLERTSKYSKYLHASVPSNENQFSSYELHIWAWDEIGFRNMIEQNFDILDYYNNGVTQYINASSKK